MTTDDTQSCQRGHELDSSDPAGDQMLSDILSGVKDGIAVEHYTRARATGATHAEIIAAHNAGVGIGLYGAIRQSGATHDEAQEVRETDLTYAQYIRARRSGVTHAEALEYRNKTSKFDDVDQLVSLRLRGVSHQALVTFIATMDGHEIYELTIYQDCLETGATPGEIQAIADLNYSLGWYCGHRQNGLSHVQTLQIATHANERSAVSAGWQPSERTSRSHR
jgi:hypothetical protein